MSAATIPYFGRAYQIIITPQGGGQQVTLSSAGSAPNLRILFEVETRMLMSVWQAKVTIYNLGASTAKSINSGSAFSLAPPISGTTLDPLLFTQALNMGDLVTVAAGYQADSGGAFNPVTNRLFKGNLMQSFGTRENVTDTKLVLRCIVNLALTSFGFASLPASAKQTDWDILQQIISKTGLAVDIDSASQSALQQKSYPRGQTIFDRPVNVIDQICKQNNVFPWIGLDGLNIRSFTSAAPLTPTFIYAPPSLSKLPQGTASTTVKPTIIGTPSQTQEGVVFRVLMDSQVQIGKVVQLAFGTAINAFEFPYMTLPPTPNPDGIYIVAGIRHSGDTRGRGDDWYSEITALTPKWFSVYAKSHTLGKS